ncbi:MAG TPA: Hsp20/alpha crystallin family protein [Actinomycetes bacterium]|jgi:HSP20 family protein|nr:Hsp20/alpha crystallin family protein [Actinomycetes bacterium]
MSVLRWDPFRDLTSIQDEINSMFDRVFGRRTAGTGREGGLTAASWAPAVDISERKDAYVVSAEVPGINPEDLDVTLEDGLLTIQGERRMEEETGDRQYHRVERRYGAFRRSITLPSQVKADAIEASYSDGVLQVVVPKSEAAQPKKIDVRSARPAVKAD